MLYSYEKMRTDFVANVSHELRTPLSSIVGYIETIKNDINLDKTTTHKFLDIMEDQAWRMTRLVEDLLLLSKYETEDKPLQFKEVEIVKVVQSAIDNLNKKIEDKNLKVILDDHYNKKIISQNITLSNSKWTADQLLREILVPDISDSCSLKVFHGDSHLSDGIRHFLGDVSIDLK